ncbi:MAG: hypothetical protein Q7R46_01965 [bacterium]|nr:hypothetical protein [bacterium]
MDTNIKTLVDLIVCRARVDKTAPSFTNPRGWNTDNLMGDVDALVVGQNNDPFTYAHICKRVLAKVRDLPEMAVLTKLAILRGERLLPIGSEREKYILQFAMEIESAISALPDGTRKMRCQSLFKYHMATFYDVCGHFDLAIAAHELSAKEADCFNDRTGAAISHFMETFYRLKEAVCKGNHPTRWQVIFLNLERKLARLLEAVRGTSLEVQWTENALAHMKEARELLLKPTRPSAL